MDLFDDLIGCQRTRRASTVDQRFEYFGTAAFTVRLQRLDQKIVSGVPMTLKRMANVLGTDATLFHEFCDRFSKYGDKTLTLYADGRAVEIPVF